MPGSIVFAVDMHSGPQSVFTALSTRDGLASFWTSDCDADPRVGSVARFGFASAEADLRMRVDDLDAGRLVRWTCLGDFPNWVGTVVTWELAPATDAHGTTVVFRHDGWPSQMPQLEHARIAYTWARIIGALKDHVETGARQPFLS